MLAGYPSSGATSGPAAGSYCGGCHPDPPGVEQEAGGSTPAFMYGLHPAHQRAAGFQIPGEPGRPLGVHQLADGAQEKEDCTLV